MTLSNIVLEEYITSTYQNKKKKTYNFVFIIQFKAGDNGYLREGMTNYAEDYSIRN